MLLFWKLASEYLDILCMTLWGGLLPIPSEINCWHLLNLNSCGIKLLYEILTCFYFESFHQNVLRLQLCHQSHMNLVVDNWAFPCNYNLNLVLNNCLIFAFAPVIHTMTTWEHLTVKVNMRRFALLADLRFKHFNLLILSQKGDLKWLNLKLI